MRADARLQRHRMTHQAADAAIPIQEWMDVIEAVMRRRDRHDAASGPEPREAIALLEMRHEGRDVSRRWRQMAADAHLLLGTRAKVARLHSLFAVVAAHHQHRARCVAIELRMQPADERHGTRLGCITGSVTAIDLALKANMRARFELEIAALFTVVEPPGERGFDLARRRVVPLDQVRVVAIHDPHRVGEARRNTRMEPSAECSGRGGQAGHQVEQFGSGLVQEARLDARRTLVEACHLIRRNCRSSRIMIR
jgi:hypothetical protein